MPEQSLIAVAASLTATLGVAVEPRPQTRVPGGCINESYRWNSDTGPLFVKVADSDRLPMLEAEAAGLRELEKAQAVRVPRVLAVGAIEECAYLALEWLDLSAVSSATSARLGEALARQHRVLAPRFGWDRDNTIGTTAQINGWSVSWPAFFRERRLRHQLALAERNGYGGRLQQRGAHLLERFAGFFRDHRPAPSLLHGDLWGGNAGVDANGAPVIFDPAVYYGDREADIAMTRLFGGFGPRFYSAYEATWPLPPSASLRSGLYNLYHVLNHLNLFGGGYLQQAEALIERQLALIGR